MKKVLLVIASVMMLGFASCEKNPDKKISVEDYPSAIIGLWELESYQENGILDEPGDGYRSVVQFSENGRYTFYDNSDYYAYDSNGEYYTSQKVSSFGSATYWVYQDKLFDRRASDDWECWEFGNPNCDCNQAGNLHVTKIIELTQSKLVIEATQEEDVVRMESRRIEKLN